MLAPRSHKRNPLPERGNFRRLLGAWLMCIVAGARRVHPRRARLPSTSALARVSDARAAVVNDLRSPARLRISPAARGPGRRAQRL